MANQISYSNTGLGDYIHFHSWSFMMHGTYRSFGKSPTSSVLANETYHKLKSLMLNTVTKGNVTDIEQFYTSLYRQQYNNDIFKKYDIEINESEIEQMERFLKQEVESRVGLNFDRQNLTVLTDLQTIQQSIYKYRGVQRGTKKIKTSSLQQIVNSMSQTLSILKKGLEDALAVGLNDKKVLQLQFNIEKIKTYEQELRAIKNTLDVDNQWGTGLNDVNSQLSGENNTIAAVIMDFYNIIKLYKKPTKKQVGDTAEIAAAIFDSIADKKANQLSGQLTKNALDIKLTGGMSNGGVTRYQISGRYTDSDIIEKNMGKVSTEWDLENGNVVQVNASAETVDVTMSFSNNNNIFGTDKLTQSIKSYSNPFSTSPFNKGISVISGTPLTAILMLTGVNFANNYLNYIANHDIGNDEESGLIRAFEVPSEVDNTLKYALAVRALSGARTNTYSNLSQYFVIFDRSSKNVKVFPTTSLLDKISSGYGSFNDSFVTIDGLPINGGSLDNSWAKTVQQRISSVLVQAHARKLSMSLNPSLFNSF